MTLSIFGAMHVPVAKAQGNDLTVFLRPGAPDPNNPGFSQTLGTLRDNPELVIDQYLEYAVLASSTGDFEFIVSTQTTLGYIEITYPCEFTFTQTSIKYSVWTDITNDYGYIDNSADDCTVTIGSHVDLGENLVIYPGTYVIRLFAMKAPDKFGLYYFQIATDLEPDGINPVNWPIVIVKGELNPGYVTGIVSADSGLTDGLVAISGTTPEGRSVNGVFPLTPGTDDYGHAMFECPNAGCPANEAGDYVYWLFGVPAGSYEVTASSIDDGYAPSTSARFSVSAAQSTHLPDLSISIGPAVMITVWSKHGRGTIPWGCLWQPPYGTNNPYSTECGESQQRDITLVIYDEAGAEVTSDTWSLDPTAVSFSQTLTVLESGKTYSMKAFVTGYVMVDADAGQRTFSVAGDMSVEMDLRRSNWFEITAHTFEPNNPMTVVYEAYNEAGDLKGLTAYVIPAGGFPADGPSFVVLEGFNHEGDTAGGDTYRDYGLEPGTYQIKMYAADGGPADPIVTGAVEGTGWYYIPADEPTTASIALCNSPSTLSFAVESITMTIILRSVDWEAPAHVRQWTFPGAEIWVNFLNADTSEVAASLDPTVWGLVQDCFDAAGLPLISGSSSWDPYLLEDARLQIKWTGDNVDVKDALTAGTYPTHIAPGQYQFEVNTLGYVTRRVFPVWVPAGGNGDIQADLIQGGEITVDVSFTKEGQDVDFTGYVRVEAYNADGKLVGANIYHQAVPNYVTSAAGGGSYANYDGTKDWKGIASGYVPCAAEGSNIDDADGDECLDGQRGYTSSLLYGVPAYTWDGWPFMEVQGIAANGLYPLPAGESERYDLFGFYWYYGAASSRNTGLWANGWDTTDGVKQNDHGLPGTRDITGATGAGLYTVKVYAFGWTPDGQYVSYYADPVENIDVQWGGYTAVSVSMAEMGRVTGTITWIDAFGNMRNMPWAMLGAGETASHSTSPLLADWGLWDNDAWVMWLPAGTYDFSVSADGVSQTFAPAGSTIVVSDGFSASYDQTLYPTGVPVPEFPATTALALLSVLSASIFLLRRKRIAKK
jgi:hypothetical protein